MEREEKLSKPVQITENEFWMRLIAIRDYFVGLYDKASEDLLAARTGLLKVQRSSDEVKEAKNLGFHIEYYYDPTTHGLFTQLKGKDQIGFKHEQGERSKEE